MTVRPKKTLTLDLGTQFVGWAIGSPGAAPSYGTHLMPSVTQEDLVTLMVDLRSFLFVHRLELGTIVYESPPILGKQIFTMRKMFAIGGLVELFGHDHEIEVLEAPVGSVRKHFMGKGFSTRGMKPYEIKAAIMARCRILGWPCKTSHEADALAILDYTLSIRGSRLAQVLG